MAIYLVCTEGDAPGLQERITSKYPEDFFVFRENSAWLVNADKTTEELARQLGLYAGKGGESNGTGVVFRLSNYTGFDRKAMWEWLELKE